MITTKVVRTLQIFVQTRTCLFLLNGLATIKTSITISPRRVGLFVKFKSICRGVALGPYFLDARGTKTLSLAGGIEQGTSCTVIFLQISSFCELCCEAFLPILTFT